jgi:hypothetical protein
MHGTFGRHVKDVCICDDLLLSSEGQEDYKYVESQDKSGV